MARKGLNSSIRIVTGLDYFVKNLCKFATSSRYNIDLCGGCSSAGRVQDCDSCCRGFEPHQPPQTISKKACNFSVAGFFYCAYCLLLHYSVIFLDRWFCNFNFCFVMLFQHVVISRCLRIRPPFGVLLPILRKALRF
jgi:hypothetical protein